MDARRRHHRLDQLSIEAQDQIAEGSADKGAEICRQLIREWTDIQGPDGEKVLIWRGFLGKALIEGQRHREAEDVLFELLVDRERLLGPDDPSVLVTRGNLARAIAFGGRPQEALLHARRLYDDRVRLVGPDDPTTLDSLGHIASFHFHDGLFSEAAEIYEELLERRIRVLGVEHPDVFQTEHNLAAARAYMRDPDDIEGLREVAELLEEELGLNHLLTLNAYGLLSETLMRVGRLTEAFDMSQMVFDGRARLLGDHDSHTLRGRAVMARILAKLDRWAEAVSEHMRVIQLHAEHGRENEAAGAPAVFGLFNTWVARSPEAPPRLDDESLKDMLLLTHWLETKCGKVELSTEYKELALSCRAVIESYLAE